MIQIHDLSFAYKHNLVLSGIKLELAEGKIIGLLGENGVGKTTLLTLLCGLKAPQAGSIDVDGRRPFDRLPSLLAEQFYLPDEVMSQRQSAEAFGLSRTGFWPNFSLEKYFDLLKEFEVDPAQRMDQMSAGQLKKTWIAFAFACRAKYYYMDEPTNGLDIPSKAQFRRVVAREITDTTTLVISTHQVRDLEDILDTVVILDTREVAVNAPVSQITEKLRFVRSAAADPEALYTEAIPGGVLQVLPNTTGEETRLEIEAFFNAVHQNKERVHTLLNA